MASGIEQGLTAGGAPAGPRNPALAVLRAAARLVVRPEARANARHEWARRLRRGARPLPPDLRSLLVICHGNICRSPFAAVLLAQSLPGISITSAGLAAEDGGPADPTAARAASRRGVSLDAHRARRVMASDLRSADLVLGMEGRHLEAALGLAPERRDRVRLLGEFLPDAPFTIVDPWGRDDEVFDRVFARIELAAKELARALRTRTG